MKKILIAVDPGNKNFDVIKSGDSKAIIVPNVVSNVKESLSLNTNIFKASTQNDLNSIDVTIDGNERLLIGGAAIKRDGRERPINKEKYNDGELVKTIKSMIAYSIVSSDKNTSQANVFLSSCLPVREYVVQNKVYEFESLLSGETVIKFNSGKLKDCEVKLRIERENILTLPDGAAALYNLLTNEKGELLDEYHQLIDKVIIVVDIGGGTVDIVAVSIRVDDEGNLYIEPEDEIVDFMSEGVLNAEEEIIKYLRISKNYELTSSELDYYIREKKCKLPNGAEEIDIEEKAEEVFSEFSKKLAKRLSDDIENCSASLRRRIVKAFITGGGALLSASERKGSIGDKTITLLSINSMISTNPLTDNVRGCLKALKAAIDDRKGTEDEAYEK